MTRTFHAGFRPEEVGPWSVPARGMGGWEAVARAAATGSCQVNEAGRGEFKPGHMALQVPDRRYRRQKEGGRIDAVL
ncbi:hypothetical protein PCL1606_21000 [Pseudomonas chlororaphis]|uniref:Uncharacterized protein n=1 Tax=Pseudomonas chlororaphis TaxID=587753 RepID=A0A0D5XXW2_9PSED|nr:hypothetical protein PCL1606_21000 [Pseudomonas chlororaphis]